FGTLGSTASPRNQNVISGRVHVLHATVEMVGVSHPESGNIAKRKARVDVVVHRKRPLFRANNQNVVDLGSPTTGEGRVPDKLNGCVGPVRYERDMVGRFERLNVLSNR